MTTIDGEWREATTEEREALRGVVFRCVKHWAALGCEASRPDCVRVMERPQLPRASYYQEGFTVVDHRRVREVR